MSVSPEACLYSCFHCLFLNACVDFVRHDLQQRVAEKEAEKQQIQEDNKGLTDKSNQLTEEMKGKNDALKNVEK